MAALRARCRLHRISDLRLARRPGKNMSGAPKACTPGDRCRPLRRRRHRIHPAALRDARAHGAAAVLARPGSVRLQRAAARARLFASGSARSASSRPGASCKSRCNAIRCCATTGSNSRRCRKQSAPRPIRSLISASRPTPAARIWRTWARTGKNSTSPSARRRRAGATAPSAGTCREFGDVRFITAADARRRAAHARNPDGAKKPRIRPQGHRRHFRPAGTSRIFSRPRAPIRRARHLVHVSRVEIGDHLRGDQSRHRVRRLLLPRARKLHGQRGRALWTGRSSSARAAGLRDQTRPQAFRFHHRRRAIQARMVATPILKLYDYTATTTWRGAAGARVVEACNGAASG